MAGEQHRGLVKLPEPTYQALVRKCRISDVYDVEHAPFAR